MACKEEITAVLSRYLQELFDIPPERITADAARAVPSRLRPNCKLVMQFVDYVADCPHGLELCGRDLLTRVFLKFYDQVDGIDAVKIQIIEQQR